MAVNTVYKFVSNILRGCSSSHPIFRQTATASSAELHAAKDANLRNSDIVPLKNFQNRNPRSLERLSLAHKDFGWGRGLSHHSATNMPSRQYYHRVFVEKRRHSTTAVLEHYNGCRVIEVSTREWYIRKHLQSPTSVDAFHIIGLVFAERCIRAGISSASWFPMYNIGRGECTKAFKKAVFSTSFALREPEQKSYRYSYPRKIIRGPTALSE